MAKLRVDNDGVTTETFMITKIKVLSNKDQQMLNQFQNTIKSYTHNDGYSPDKGLKRIASVPLLFQKFGQRI